MDSQCSCLSAGEGFCLCWLGLGQPGPRPQVASDLCSAWASTSQLTSHLIPFLSSAKPCVSGHVDLEMNQVWSPPVQSSPSSKGDGWVKVNGEKYSRGNKCGDRNMCTVCVGVFFKNNLFRIRLCTELEFTRERVSVIMTICSCVSLPVQLGKLRATWMSEPLLQPGL